MKFVFFSVSEKGENGLNDGAEGGNAPRIFGLEPPLEIWHNGSSRGRNQLCCAFFQPVEGHRFCGVKFCPSPLTQNAAVDTVLRYRAPVIVYDVV